MNQSRLPATRALVSLAVASAISGMIAAPALAQPAAAPATPAAEPAAAAPAQPTAAPAPASQSALFMALAPVPGGLTPAQVAERASATSYSVRSKQEELRAAQARVDQALVGYFPRLSLSASYARLSEVDNTLGSGPIVITLDSPLDNYSLVASLIVPISDYVLRISDNHASATRSADAAALSVQAQQLQTASDAKVSFYNWVRAKGQVVVAREAVAQTKAHLVDARQTFEVGLISRADVLRLEAQQAAAEQTEAEALAFASVAERQLRTVLHAPEGQAMQIGVDVMHEPGETPASLDDLVREAMTKRLEVRAIEQNVAALRSVESVAKASYLPRLDAFADGTYANPNQRIFPSQEQWDFTWAAGARATWTLNETFTAMGTVTEARARTASLEAQKQALQDALTIEVASAYADVSKSGATIAAADRGVIAAEESLRVRRELFRAGKATGVDIVDAEAELTRARLRQLDARIGLAVAKTRLEHATGRDVGTLPPPAPPQP